MKNLSRKLLIIISIILLSLTTLISFGGYYYMTKIDCNIDLSKDKTMGKICDVISNKPYLDKHFNGQKPTQFLENKDKNKNPILNPLNIPYKVDSKEIDVHNLKTTVGFN